MKKTSVVLCSYSHGQTNGIAHIDADMFRHLDRGSFALRSFVLRADFPAGRQEERDGFVHLSLVDAFAVLCEALKDADVLHVNGSLDPVAANAASVAGVPGIIEVMHQVEPGGLHDDTDMIVCVSEGVRRVQVRKETTTILNGIDLDRFPFKAGRRDPETVRIAQVANASKILPVELGDVITQSGMAGVDAFTVGDRDSKGLPCRGVVADMATVYHDADILFMPERNAAFGLVYAEALACGTIPFLSVHSAIASFLTPGAHAWLADVDVPADICETLRLAVDTVGSPRFETMQLQGRELCEKAFGLRHMLRNYEALYQELGNRPRRTPKREAAWMELVLCALLARQGNPALVDSLERFLAEPRLLEPSFLRHPAGQSVICFVLERVCPTLLAAGGGPSPGGASVFPVASFAPGFAASGRDGRGGKTLDWIPRGA